MVRRVRQAQVCVKKQGLVLPRLKVFAEKDGLVHPFRGVFVVAVQRGSRE